jgi:hypothetical protein
MPETKTEAEIKLALELDTEKKKYVDLEGKLKKQDDLEKEVTDLKEYRAKAEAEKKDLALQLKAKALDADVEKLLTEKSITPAMKVHAKLILEQMGQEDKKEYTIKTDKDEKKVSAFELVKEFLKLHTAANVNLTERSEDGDKEAKEVEAKLIADAEKYAEENKMKFSTALKILKSQTK